MTKRKINIEFIRLFAIFMTVMIHVSNIYIINFPKITDGYFLTSVVYNSLSRICVPLFFMVSGIFLINQEYDRKKYFGRILKFTLILVIWSVIYYLYNNDFNLINITEVIFNSLFNADKTSRHLWFLYAIIGIYIALPFISNMCKNLSRKEENLFLTLWLLISGLIVVIVPLARYVTKSNVDMSYPIPIINSAYYLGYFISGHILYERFKDVKADKRKNIICLIGYILPTLITIFVTYFISLNTGELYQPMTWYRSIFIAIAAISVFIFIVINEGKFKNEVIGKISKYSFGIYLLHMIFLKEILENFNIVDFNPIIAVPVITAVVYLISLLASFIISKIPYLKKLI